MQNSSRKAALFISLMGGSALTVLIKGAHSGCISYCTSRSYHYCC